MDKTESNARQFPVLQENCRARTAKTTAKWKRTQPQGWCMLIVCAMVLIHDIGKAMPWKNQHQNMYIQPQKGQRQKGYTASHGRDRKRGHEKPKISLYTEQRKKPNPEPEWVRCAWVNKPEGKVGN